MHKKVSYTELLVCLRNIQNTDPFAGIQQEEVCVEDIPELQADPDEQYVDVDIIVDQCEYTFKVGRTDFLMEAMQRECKRPLVQNSLRLTK